MTVYRVTVEYETVVWADSVADAEAMAEDAVRDELGDPLVQVYEVKRAKPGARVAYEDDLPHGGPGDWTVGQLLDGEHEEPPAPLPVPGRTDARLAAAIESWLRGQHGVNPLRPGLDPALMSGFRVWSNGNAAIAVPDADATDQKQAAFMEQFRAATDADQARWSRTSAVVTVADIAAAIGGLRSEDLDVYDRDPPHVAIGDALINAGLLRCYAWGPAVVSGDESLRLTWAPGVADAPIGVIADGWDAVIMPIYGVLARAPLARWGTQANAEAR